MLSRALDTYNKLEKPRDTEWIHIVLSFLKTYVEHDFRTLMQTVDCVSELVNSLRTAVENLETGEQNFQCHHTFSNPISKTSHTPITLR